MHVHVYKSQRRTDTYVYLPERDAFDRLPEGLRSALGTLTYVVSFELTPDRRLAREDAATVRANVQERGYHIQHPPEPVQAHAD